MQPVKVLLAAGLLRCFLEAQLESDAKEVTSQLFGRNEKAASCRSEQAGRGSELIRFKSWLQKPRRREARKGLGVASLCTNIVSYFPGCRVRQNGVFAQQSPALFSVLLMTVSSEAGSQSEMIIGRAGFCWLPNCPES